MLKRGKQSCPWCGENLAKVQLGTRDVNRKKSWYSGIIRVQESVCPYCNQVVESTIKTVWCFLILTPMFAFSLLQMALGAKVVPDSPWSELSIIATLIGFLLLMYLRGYKKP